jgi:hypothetical protein
MVNRSKLWRRLRRTVAAVEPSGETYTLVRRGYLQGLGVIFLFAFLSLLVHLDPLFGESGLLPARRYIPLLKDAYDGHPFWSRPTLFLFHVSDPVMAGLAWTGLALSAALAAGCANAVLVAALWVIYLSFVNIGQIFYGYGWESILLEATFLAIFLCPLTRFRLSKAPLPPPLAVIWFIRWLIFRVMFGAGLIKLRGDACWRDLTCLIYHYETQPIPNPLSWYLHQAPPWFHKLGTLSNHIVEVIIPLFLFGPRRFRIVAGILFILFQVMLILSGNLSWLNWLTIVIAVPCFDDRALRACIPMRFRRERAEDHPPVVSNTIWKIHRGVIGALAVLLLVLSVNPIRNMLSPHQVMNRSFDPFYIMGTYGAFGSIGRERYEVILEGTRDRRLTPDTVWEAYEFPAKPGRLDRRPAIVAPFHYRLDWQIWFAAMQDYRHNPWLVHLVYKLLQGDDTPNRLLAHNPFPDAPPAYIRIEHYRYRFTKPDDTSKNWWTRERIGTYLPPLSLDDPSLREFLEQHRLLE